MTIKEKKKERPGELLLAKKYIIAMSIRDKVTMRTQKFFMGWQPHLSDLAHHE